MTRAQNTDETTAASQDQGVGESIGELGSAAADLGKEAQAQVTNLTDQVRQQATQQLMSQKEKAVDTLETVALLLHQAGEHAHLQEKEMLASYVDKAANQVGKLSESLGAQDVTQIVESTKQFARREPMLFVGGALAAGFLGARFFRSSSQPQQQAPEIHEDADVVAVDDGMNDLPAYDIDQTSMASSTSLLDTPTASSMSDVGLDDTSILGEYAGAVLEGDAFEADVADTTALTDIEDIDNPERL